MDISRIDTPETRDLVGRAMIALSIAGVVIAVAGTIVGWRLVGDIRDATDDSLAVTIDSLDTVENTVDLSERVLTALSDTVDATESTLIAANDSFVAGSSVIGEVTELTGTVGPSLGEVARILRQLETVGSTIDGLLGDLSDIPFAPSYDPEQELGATIGSLADEVGQLPAQFDSTSADLAEFDRSVLDITTQLDDLANAVGEVRSGLTGTQLLITQYRQNVDDARIIALDTDADLDADVRLMRIVLVAGGFTLAFGQIVPLWLGLSLLARRRTDRQGDVLVAELEPDGSDAGR